jgi:hypothetical protein
MSSVNDGTRATAFSYPLTTSNTDAGHSKTFAKDFDAYLCNDPLPFFKES